MIISFVSFWRFDLEIFINTYCICISILEQLYIYYSSLNEKKSSFGTQKWPKLKKQLFCILCFQMSDKHAIKQAFDDTAKPDRNQPEQTFHINSVTDGFRKIIAVFSENLLFDDNKYVEDKSRQRLVLCDYQFKIMDKASENQFGD